MSNFIGKRVKKILIIKELKILECFKDFRMWETILIKISINIIIIHTTIQTDFAGDFLFPLNADLEEDIDTHIGIIENIYFLFYYSKL